jgi:hypothetical protein
MKTRLLLILVSILSIGGVGRAQWECPNTMATQIPAKVKDYGPFRRCSVGVTLFGSTFGLVGGRCPKLRVITPAHQACRGAANPACDCSFQTVIGASGVEIVGGKCECWNEGNAGTVQDAQTGTCPT